MQQKVSGNMLLEGKCVCAHCTAACGMLGPLHIAGYGGKFIILLTC